MKVYRRTDPSALERSHVEHLRELARQLALKLHPEPTKVEPHLHGREMIVDVRDRNGDWHSYELTGASDGAMVQASDVPHNEEVEMATATKARSKAKATKAAPRKGKPTREAILRELKGAEAPMSSAEVAEKVLARRDVRLKGKTPEATVKATLYVLATKGDVIKTGKGRETRFALAD
jgi:hypothetical protein